MNNILRFLLIGLIAVAAVAVWDGFYVLREGQQAVITQFGRPVGQSILTAGLKFKLPVIQKVQYFDKRILVWDGDPNQIPTNDKTFIYMDNTARWRIVDPLRFLQAVGTERRAMTLLGDILDGTVRDLVNKNDLIEIIRSSDWSPDFMATTIQCSASCAGSRSISGPATVVNTQISTAASAICRSRTPNGYSATTTVSSMTMLASGTCSRLRV